MQFPIIRTARLMLRKPSERDAQKLLQVSQDKVVMQYSGMEVYKTEQDALEEINWFNGIFDDSRGIRWIICEKNTDEYIGDVGFHNHSQTHSRAEVGYKLSRLFWRKGIMTEALSKVLEYGFGEMQLNRIEALVDPRNTASRKLLEKQQFKTEGVLRQYEYKGREYVDLAMLSLLKEDWRVGQAP
jgi:ribosomal-protein-alanine N-acetyltransferase